MSGNPRITGAGAARFLMFSAQLCVLGFFTETEAVSLPLSLSLCVCVCVYIIFILYLSVYYGESPHVVRRLRSLQTHSLPSAHQRVGRADSAGLSPSLKARKPAEDVGQTAPVLSSSTFLFYLGIPGNPRTPTHRGEGPLLSRVTNLNANLFWKRPHRNTQR